MFSRPLSAQARQVRPDNRRMFRLVFLPGLACDERTWDAQLAAVPPGLAACVSDAHMRHDRIESMAAAVLADNPGPLLLCGASMGGMIAMEAARQAPQRIAGLALLGTNARPETPDMCALRESAIRVFERGEARALIELNAHFAMHKTQAADSALLRHYIDIVLDAGADQLIRQNRALMLRPDARLHLSQLRCPVLVACGDGDLIAPPECSREVAALVPQAELSWLAECGHMLTLEKPVEVNALLAPWLHKLLLNI